MDKFEVMKSQEMKKIEVGDDEYPGLIVHDIIEHEDGSATVRLDMDNKALMALVQYAFTAILKKAVEVNKETL